MREAKALKEYFKIKELFIVIGIVMCIPYIPLTQKIEKNLLLLGFPYKFYSMGYSLLRDIKKDLPCVIALEV